MFSTVTAQWTAVIITKVGGRESVKGKENFCVPFVIHQLLLAGPLVPCSFCSNPPRKNLQPLFIRDLFSVWPPILCFLGRVMIHPILFTDPNFSKNRQTPFFFPESHLDRECSLYISQAHTKDHGQTFIQIPGTICLLEGNQLYKRIIFKDFGGGKKKKEDEKLGSLIWPLGICRGGSLNPEKGYSKSTNPTKLPISALPQETWRCRPPHCCTATRRDTLKNSETRERYRVLKNSHDSAT